MPAPVVLVTGASRGIGRLTAVHLAGQGARLALIARSAEGLAETVADVTAAGADAGAAVADVTDREAVDLAVEELARALGPIDVLINNAGLPGPIGELWEVEPRDWWETVEVNLLGTYLCARAVLPSMTARRQGRIVNVVSNAGAHRWPYFTPYATSKAAVIKLTESLAVETRPYGIAVLAGHPGLVRGAGFSEAIPPDAPPPPPDSIEGRAFAWFEREHEEGRTVSAEQAAAFLADLASGRADALSGRYIAIEDDLDALIDRAEEVRRDNLQALKVERLKG